MRRVRILHVIQNLNYGGMERLFADIIRLLDPTQFDSHVIVLDGPGRFSEGLDQFSTMHRAAPLSRWSLLHPGRLVTQIRAMAPDIVHTHGGVWYKVSLAARSAGVPRVIHTEHGRFTPDRWFDRLVARLAARRTDLIVAVSEPLRDHLVRHVVSPSAVLTVIPNGVDTELHRPRPDTGKLRQELGLGPDTPIIGSIGRLEAIKGFDVMVRAFAALRSAWDGPVPPVLLIVGEGSQRALLERLIAQLGLRGAAYLPGWRDDVSDLHSAFTLFTMSSQTEGTSVSLLEAMSAALCPVVTDVGGNAAVLGTELAHRLVPSRDPARLAAAWARALHNREELERDRTLARARIESSFSLRAMVDGYSALYAPAGPRVQLESRTVGWEPSVS